jgi:uncharacterized protein YggE
MFAQTKNFLDQPYVETRAYVDTLVVPDRIYMSITIAENDTKGKTSVEELEKKMTAQLSKLGIDLQKQLTVQDVGSDFKKYFLKQKDVLKTKSYLLLVYDANMATRVLIELEKENISNVSVAKTEYSKFEDMEIELKKIAVQKARKIAGAMAEALDRKIGAAVYISDLNSPIRALGGKVAGIVVSSYSKSKSNEEYTDLNIDFNKIKIEAEVSVKFLW